MIYVLYTDESILAAPNQDDIDQAIKDITKAGLNITIEGDIQDFLGVNMERKDDGTITFSQPHLIDKILRAVRLGTEGKNRNTPAAVSRILKRHADSPNFDRSFDYRSVVGMLNYLDAGSRSNIAYATHQCARFAAKPKEEHATALRWIARYLRGTRDKGMTFKPDPSLGSKCLSMRTSPGTGITSTHPTRLHYQISWVSHYLEVTATTRNMPKFNGK